MLTKTFLIVIALYISYRLNVTPIVDFLQHFFVYWNIFVYTVTTLRQNHPALYIALTPLLIWLLAYKDTDAEL